MLILAVLVLAAATSAWPSDLAARRLRAFGDHSRSRRPRGPRQFAFGAIGCAAVLGWIAAGPGGAMAVVMIGVTVWHQLRDRRRIRAALTATEGLADAIRALVAELRSGAHPADAAEGAARDAPGPVAHTLCSAAAAVRLGGDVEAAFGSTGPAATVGRAWRLAGRHGLALAPVLDAVRTDLDHQVRFARQVLARMAGPRAGAMVLAALPAVGLLLGHAMGAAPIEVLTGGLGGQALLVVGVALECAGVWWSARLTGRVISG